MNEKISDEDIENINKNYKSIYENIHNNLKLLDLSNNEYTDKLYKDIFTDLNKIEKSTHIINYMFQEKPIIPQEMYMECVFNLGTILKKIFEEKCIINKKIMDTNDVNLVNKSLEYFKLFLKCNKAQ